MSGRTRALIWQRVDEHPGSEHCIITTADDAVTLDGSMAIALHDQPLRVSYRVTGDGAWRTRAAEITLMDGAAMRRLQIAVDDGRWIVDGGEHADLHGCTEIDLEITPATNTLPIRRLGLAVGESREIMAAWVRFPGLTIRPSAQRYTRLAARRYRYESATYQTEIDVDDDGLVTHYPDGWKRVAIHNGTLG